MMFTDFLNKPKRFPQDDNRFIIDTDDVRRCLNHKRKIANEQLKAIIIEWIENHDRARLNNLIIKIAGDDCQGDIYIPKHAEELLKMVEVAEAEEVTIWLEKIWRILGDG